jgi:hypothetical protein
MVNLSNLIISHTTVTRRYNESVEKRKKKLWPDSGQQGRSLFGQRGSVFTCKQSITDSSEMVSCVRQAGIGTSRLKCVQRLAAEVWWRDRNLLQTVSLGRSAYSSQVLTVIHEK